MPSLLKIHDARDAQLGLIAAAQGTTKAGALDFLIGLAVAQGVIPDRVPGFEAEARDGHVFLTVGGEHFPSMTPKIAAGFADLLVRVAMGDLPGFKTALHTGDSINVGRKGTGILIALADPTGCLGATSALTASITGDLCRALHTAALMIEHA